MDVYLTVHILYVLFEKLEEYVVVRSKLRFFSFFIIFVQTVWSGHKMYCTLPWSQRFSFTTKREEPRGRKKWQKKTSGCGWCESITTHPSVNNSQSRVHYTVMKYSSNQFSERHGKIKQVLHATRGFLSHFFLSPLSLWWKKTSGTRDVVSLLLEWYTPIHPQQIFKTAFQICASTVLFCSILIPKYFVYMCVCVCVLYVCMY